MIARTSGSFPVRLSVTVADGKLAVTGPQPVQFRVRSTVYNAVGIAIGASALAFLVLWWGTDIRRRRRRRAELRNRA